MEYDSTLRRRILFGLGGMGLLLGVVFVLLQFQVTLVFTVFLYYASRPIYRKLETLSVPSRLQSYPLPYRRQVLAIATICIFLLPFLSLLIYTLVLVVPEIQRFAGGDGPGAAYLAAVQSAQGSGLPAPLEGLRTSDLLEMSPDEFAAILNDPAVQTWVARVGSTLIDSVGLIATAALHGFLLFAGTYYLLTDGSRLAGWFLDHFDQSGVLESYVAAVDDELSSILFGNILNAFVTGIIGILVFTGYNLIAPGAVKVPFAPLVGALTGAGSLIPVVGMKIVYLPVGVILAVAAIASGQPSAVGFVVLFLVLAFVVVDTIPDFVIRPYVSGKRTHVGLLMFAYILGPIAFGFHGIFLGPILLVLVAQFFRTIAPYVLTGSTHRQSTLTEYQAHSPTAPAQPVRTDTADARVTLYKGLDEHAEVATVGYRFGTGVTVGDFEALTREIEQRTEDHEALRLYLEFDGNRPSALETIDDDLKLRLEQRHGLERCAVVGDSRFVEWSDELNEGLTSADVKSFPLADRDGAWEWLQR